jgi:uncharacterized protein
MSLQPFHIAFPVDNLTAARHFYGELLQCPEGRSSNEWIDFNLYGHQIVAHLAPEHTPNAQRARHKAALQAAGTATNEVDGHDVPVPHFGVVLTMQDWETLAARLKSHHVKFGIEPYVRFKGQVGEQATMFFMDPAGNSLEFKAFGDIGQLFAK